MFHWMEQSWMLLYRLQTSLIALRRKKYQLHSNFKKKKFERLRFLNKFSSFEKKTSKTSKSNFVKNQNVSLDGQSWMLLYRLQTSLIALEEKNSNFSPTSKKKVRALEILEKIFKFWKKNFKNFKIQLCKKSKCFIGCTVLDATLIYRFQTSLIALEEKSSNFIPTSKKKVRALEILETIFKFWKKNFKNFKIQLCKKSKCFIGWTVLDATLQASN